MNDLSSVILSAAYRAQHHSLHFGAAAFQRVVRLLARETRSIPAADLGVLHRRYLDLLDRDLANARAGVYPASMLRFPFEEHARAVPALLLDLPRAYRRARDQNFRDVPAEASRYPAYYRRNFHWQTDGYLSRRSAAIYDLAVEVLFGGTADVMRRQILPPLASHLRAGGRVLDVACGTGRTLQLIFEACPGARPTGLDLSPYYVQQARELLSHIPDLSLVVDNAERLPFRDEYFDAVTSVHLFHELPRDARRRVMSEALRVLSPGGLLVVEDSMQLSDSGELAVFAGNFAEDFHEPYYKGYLQDDLGDALREVGFDVISQTPYFVAKVVVARKPGGAA